MNFRIADTFTDSLAKLTGDEQKAVKTTAFDLQLNPASPGMKFHKLDQAKDKNFWSVRVSSDIRIIVHKSAGSLLMCYVDHHDDAYHWAERRRLETHPHTGAAQLVEVRETVKEIVVPVYVQEEQPKPRKPALFADRADDELLGYGVPAEWLDDVRQADEDSLLALAERLPGEAAEALLELATGGEPRPAEPATPSADPFEHPDAQRRFRVVANVEELERALDYPWDKWTVFLHPEQRQWVERDYNGPARVSGSAGTGKTIVALHRAVYLARQHPDARILLTTFSDPLAGALRTRLRRLVGNEPRLAERIDVHSLEAVGTRLYQANCGSLQLPTAEQLRELLSTASAQEKGHPFSLTFLISEWEQVVDARQLSDWESYRTVPRLGRKTRLPENQRTILWDIFERVRQGLSEQNLTTPASMFTQLADILQAAKHPPYDFAVVDEAQDISFSQLKFFASLGSKRPDALFFAGDLGQRIFQQPFSWKSAGVDIRGRSRTLRINYRTSHQIRRQADRLLGSSLADVDGNQEQRNDTISAFNGPPPIIRICESEAAETNAVSDWLTDCSADNILPHEIGVFVRSPEQIDRAQAALKQAGVAFNILDQQVETLSGSAAIGTMHLAKGLEFRAVAVIACDDEVIPSQERIEAIGDEADLREIYDTERQLLYVACTRARDRLLVTGVSPGSEFVDDLG